MTSRAKPRFTSRHSNSQPTNQDNQSTDTVLQKWAGDQLSRTTWVNMMLKKAAQVFVWKQLVTSGTVPIQRSGQTAVFSADHGVEHFNGHNKGSWRSPSERAREQLTIHATGATPSATTSTATHGGYPSGPSSALTAPSHASPRSAMDALGEHAGMYKCSPDSIEAEDLEFLNFFLDGIENTHVQEKYRKKCSDSGRLFIRIIMKEIEDDDESLTTEDVVDAKMKAILSGGLSEATYDCYVTTVGQYEAWHDTREDHNRIPDGRFPQDFSSLLAA